MRQNPPVSSIQPNVAFGKWHGATAIQPRNYHCGFCDSAVGSNTGFISVGEGRNSIVMICPACNQPTYFQHGVGPGIPGVKPGPSVSGAGPEVIELYEEARSAASANAFTAAVMVCRKLLMNISVDLGAKPNLKFVQYVNFLAENSFVSPRMKEYTDYLRTLGNDANHEIDHRTKDDAEIAIDFIAAIIRHNYEMPMRLPSSLKAKTGDGTN